MESNFIEIIQIIQRSRTNAIKAVNAELINLYWNIGAYISDRLASAEWGDKTVKDLATYIRENNPEIKGFSRPGLYRMIQFFETYKNSKFVSSLTQTKSGSNSIPIVSSLMRQFHTVDIKDSILVKISWTHHMTIFSRCKVMEEREFYMKLSIQENYSVRELERQISSSLFERAIMDNDNRSLAQLQSKVNVGQVFKDSYVFDFLNLPETHSEGELQNGLISQMKDFILELGKDFIFIGEEYKLQVGNSDFYIDLLFYHRGLQCLVAFELKADKFKPEHIGQLNFYLEALDRDVKKPHENPSIGILLCKDKDIQVVEYALSRSLSPTMVAQYRTQLPDKKLLQDKLNDLFEQGIDNI